MALNTTAEIIEDIKQGKMVIIMDDEDRENEGDLVMAAEAVTPEAINFMVKYGRGLVCMPITEERANRLKLWPQSTRNFSRFSTNFTVSIEAANGVTTGISAHDRATTILAAVAEDAKAEDVVQPGHIFPIVAQPGGVLTRAGHTEAGCDLARLSGYNPAAVIVEILNDDGTMARRPDLEEFAEQHELKIGTIADLIAYRLEREKTVAKVAESEVVINSQSLRLIVYQDAVDEKLHYALAKGYIHSDQPTFVRVHVQNVFKDLFNIESLQGSWSLSGAIERLCQEKTGVVVILADENKQADIVMAIHNMGNDAPASNNLPVNSNKELRTYGIGAQILSDLNVGKMRLLSAPMRFTGMSGFNLEVVEYLN